MIHGNLKGVRPRQPELSILLSLSIKANILIDQTGNARLADSGLLAVVSDSANLSSSSSYTQGDVARWMSPELIDPQQFGLAKGRPTVSSDCYALGMVVYETISGHVPFHWNLDMTVSVKVLKGERPPRGAHFTDNLWKMLELCWNYQPSNRPSIEDVLRCLEMKAQYSQKSPPLLLLSFPPAQHSVPFPSSSSLLSPLSPTEPQDSSFALRSPIPRKASSPIILSNDKPLKPSLKSSSSSPHLPQITHIRAQSTPATPNLLKNVHFAESDDGLESVRVFNRSGKPANISRPAGEETETETEAEPSPYPFPQPHGPSPLVAQSALPIVDADHSTPLPNSSNPHANIYIETLSLPKSRPAALYGSILVRNIAFEKQVTLMFTLDDWQTTSEVLCKHVSSLAHLPPPFPRSRTVGDVIGQLANSESGSQAPKWDRFSFVVHLELYEQKLTEHNIHFVGRFTAPGIGEWWDNNDGMNYRVSFKRPPSFPSSPSQNRSFTTPSMMKPTPVIPSLPIDTGVLPFPKLSSVLPSPPSLPHDHDDDNWDPVDTSCKFARFTPSHEFSRSFLSYAEIKIPLVNLQTQ